MALEARCLQGSWRVPARVSCLMFSWETRVSRQIMEGLSVLFLVEGFLGKTAAIEENCLVLTFSCRTEHCCFISWKALSSLWITSASVVTVTSPWTIYSISPLETAYDSKIKLLQHFFLSLKIPVEVTHIQIRQNKNLLELITAMVLWSKIERFNYGGPLLGLA